VRLDELHNEEPHDLYTLPNIIRVIKERRVRWVGHVAHMGELRNAYSILDGKPEGKMPLGRPRHGWEDNFRVDLMDMGWEVVDWKYLAQDRDQWRPLVNMVMNLRLHKKGKISCLGETVSFPRRTVLHGVHYLCHNTLQLAILLDYNIQRVNNI
jgi:hypothetical protein